MEKKLPTWIELDVMKTRGADFTALDLFIYDQEPAGLLRDQFREQLLNVINEVELHENN